MSAVTAGDDPRDASAETKMSFPQKWTTDNLVLFLSGLVMVTRNRYLAWPNLFLTLCAWFNQHSLRTKESSNSPTSALMICVSALVASYLPLITVQPGSTSTQPPQPMPLG
ncbi:hypothetical protein PHLGIDRAFT_71132 [Phlebiopsis gigantea 11061_1 CR5-6]|uniref:Uncharacterized protein n=1 Tax=Phlebiopsis gigantea (strain 11061_1 CR5-6) TaxID=745531 RepID=A0A0C3NQG0_PHLG1|nr:hypothetical protein PHLGIDRAFT_71132 [Phlebiopsis gigantea 11061_1 CR5-6]